MHVSIFTPTHDPRYLSETYASIKGQSFDEWVIVPNAGATVPDFGDPRVKVFPLAGYAPGVGRLKAFACNRCSGDVLVELDHDDLLADGAIDAVRAAFAAPRIGFVFSNSAAFTADFLPVKPYDASYGWRYRPVVRAGRELGECIAFPPSPASMSRIWYAPNHVRAWRRSAYEEAGGFSANLRVNDDQELLARTYLTTACAHVDKCLYFYRHHPGNTCYQPGTNELIQQQTMQIYDQYIQQLCRRWAELSGLDLLDIGGRFNCAPGFRSVDLKDADVIADLNGRWPFPDSSVGVIVANDVLEHLRDKLHAIREIYRVLAPGGYFLSRTPSTDGRGAFQDPTHVAYYNENSFWYYTNAAKARWIDTPVRFQSLRLYTTPPNGEGVCWVVSHLLSLKDGQRPPGPIEI
jgi:O-antigen biosynthesis protein